MQKWGQLNVINCIFGRDTLFFAAQGSAPTGACVKAFCLCALPHNGMNCSPF